MADEFSNFQIPYMSLYFWILCFSIAGPFLMSFDSKVGYYRLFRKILLASLVVALPFLAWDMYFTHRGIWGFNADYLQGIFLYNLPLEECLFFFVVPFACLFIHEVQLVYFPVYKAPRLTRIFAWCISLSALLLFFFYMDRAYTATACVIAFLLTVYFFFIRKAGWYPRFVLTYLFVLLPFLVVNGILTGAVTQEPVVWYDPLHITGVRMGTIPLEDLYYNYDLLLPIIALLEHLKSRKSKF